MFVIKPTGKVLTTTGSTGTSSTIPMRSRPCDPIMPEFGLLERRVRHTSHLRSIVSPQLSKHYTITITLPGKLPNLQPTKLENVSAFAAYEDYSSTSGPEIWGNPLKWNVISWYLSGSSSSRLSSTAKNQHLVDVNMN